MPVTKVYQLHHRTFQLCKLYLNGLHRAFYCNSNCKISVLFDNPSTLTSRSYIFSTLSSLGDCTVSIDDFRSLKNNLNSTQTSIWPYLLQYAASNDCPELRKSLTDYILNDKHEHTNTTLVNTLRLLAIQRRYTDFKNLYTELLVRLDPLEKKVFLREFIRLVSRTPFWRESLDLLLSPELEECDTSSFYHNMCSSALRFDDFSDVFECMHRLKHSPKDFVFLDFFNKLNGLEEKEAVNLIDQLFQLISAHGWIMTSPVVKHIQLWFSNSASKNWVGDLSAHISDRGYSCSVCNGSLPLPDMSQFQFSEMADKFYETVLKGTDVDDLFISGLSDEVVTVKRFLDSQTEPLDCIIDFLNLINLRRNFSVSGFFVAEVLRKLNRDFNLRRFCFVSKGNTILHNRRFWEVIKTLGDQLGISVHKFCTNVTSEDDAFLLYMALKSGPQCYILSQDQFTNYRFSSGPELGEKISRWQSLRQIVLLNSGPIYQKPSKCDLRVHGNVDNGWHIPYYSGELKIFHAAVNSWLCLRRLK